MYSKYGLQLIKHALLPSTILGSSSIHFSPETKTFYTTKFSRRNLLLGSTILISFTVFFSWRTLEIFLWKGGKSNEYFRMCFVLSLAFVMFSSVSIFINVRQCDICQVLTRLVRYCSKFEGNFKKN